MTTQPTALRLADAIEQGNYNHEDVIKAAAELRRLSAVNAELLEALKWIERRCPELFIKEPIPTKLHWEAAYDAGACARAAIKKAGGEA